MDNNPKSIQFETKVLKGNTSFALISLLAVIGGWLILLGLGGILLSQFSNPITVSISLIVAGIIIKYSFLGLLHYRSLKLLKKQ